MTRGRQRVIVVGGGLAGLTAAYELSKQPKYDVLVIEKRERLGGRVLSLDLRGVRVDLGGFLIFPWYDHYRSLCRELGIRADLRDVPKFGIYYDLGDGQLLDEMDFDFRLRSLIRVGARSLTSAFLSGSVDHPKLDYYDHMTIAECIERWEPNPDEAFKYKLLADAICQGYCYPPIEKYRAAFAAPIYPRSLLRGDSSDSDMLCHGADTLPRALGDALVDQGGRVRLGCEALRFDGGRIRSSLGEIEGDRFVFALTADHPLYRDLVPPATAAVAYTRFVTAVVTLEQPHHGDNDHWAAIFMAPRDSRADQVTSIVHTQRLYGTDALELHYIVNIRTTAPAKLDDAGIAAAVAEILEGGNRPRAVVTKASWAQAMPISHEDFVRTIRALQGIGGRYFAGDYLGCPSMEVAVRTGQAVAQRIIDDD